MKVKVKFVDDNAKELYLKASKGKSEFPFKTYDQDFCYDVVATSCKEVAPNVYKYGIGLAFQIVKDTELISRGEDITNVDGEVIGFLPGQYVNLNASDLNLSIDFRPRSSVWKTGMVLSNSEGTIDYLFTGEVSAVFYHVNTALPKYEIGDRIGQIKIGVTFPIEFVEAKELSQTSRGAGGFGSTGK